MYLTLSHHLNSSICGSTLHIRSISITCSESLNPKHPVSFSAFLFFNFVIAVASNENCPNYSTFSTSICDKFTQRLKEYFSKIFSFVATTLCRFPQF